MLAGEERKTPCDSVSANAGLAVAEATREMIESLVEGLPISESVLMIFRGVRSDSSLDIVRKDHDFGASENCYVPNAVRWQDLEWKDPEL